MEFLEVAVRRRAPCVLVLSRRNADFESPCIRVCTCVVERTRGRWCRDNTGTVHKRAGAPDNNNYKTESSVVPFGGALVFIRTCRYYVHYTPRGGRRRVRPGGTGWDGGYRRRRRRRRARVRPLRPAGGAGGRCLYLPHGYVNKSVAEIAGKISFVCDPVFVFGLVRSNRVCRG